MARYLRHRWGIYRSDWLQLQSWLTRSRREACIAPCQAQAFPPSGEVHKQKNWRLGELLAQDSGNGLHIV
jgi:hypothetical protein